MKKGIVFILALLLAACSAGYYLLGPQPITLKGSTAADTDSYVSAKMQELGIPGMALGIVNGGNTYLKGYGRADSAGKPVTPSTPFMLGSTTKSITAAAVMQLAEQGKINLDERVTAYLPDFRFKDAQSSALITVRQLLNQTSGIAGQAGHSDYWNDKSTSRDFVFALANESLLSAPGKRFEYAEANYVILGEIIAAVSGQSYESYIREHLFNPLAMAHSYTNRADAEQGSLSAGHITWFGLPVQTKLPYPRQYVSASSLFSCAEDLTHYIRMYLQDGSYNGNAVLSAESIKSIVNPAVTLEHPAGYSYGMGWFVKENLIMHDGRPTNYYSILLISREKGAGVVLLANANNRLITAEYLMPMAYELMNVQTGEPTLPQGMSFGRMYATINILFLWVGVLLVFRIILTFTSWRKKVSGIPTRAGVVIKGLWPDILSLALVGLLFGYLLNAYGVPLQVAYLGQPDIVCSLFVFLLLPVINIVCRVMLMLNSHRKGSI
ncbi:serine hydrolase domain-containing protein [Acetanaerobacterium elongatum]|uniref:CubicO group peptidase, beta-lactamase class C family n=1 Tax=Acetanaerobacterium elongatum TaxID=258515 RepID=A0A1G9XXJ1_9FIRM|nr:serine hydrolase domain-containing protein [Acetanaerobacterium elongatum]SDN01478.1 CubicO group peptidase, beta-lactamase class C family [Acetanaerobacterium elongatum]